jgi:dienelactone hydrolase
MWIKKISRNLIGLLLTSGLTCFLAHSQPTLQVAAFTCDVTPPVGHPLCGGWIKPMEAVDDPLLAKGIVLSDGHRRWVLCAVDWCLLQTGAHDLFCRKLAAATAAPEIQVAVHTVHQHNAPLADANAQRLLNTVTAAPPHLDLKFLEEVTDRVANAAREAQARLTTFTHIGFGQAQVEKFASNRRLYFADARIHQRSSSTKDPALHAAPEGLIDPWLRTVTFFANDTPLVRLHYYASHPQSYYGDGRATSDTVGLARQRLEQEEKAPQIYFTGCGGNVAAGKYNDGTPRAREELTSRIYTAMKQSAAATQRAPAASIAWKLAPVKFVPRQEPEWSEARARQRLADTNTAALGRLKAALDLAWLERLKQRPTVDTSRLRIGPVTILHLPGEAFVEYQLYAQSLRPADFIAVAAYGESGPGYICCDDSLTEGGYEPTMSRVGPPTEFRLKAAIADLLGGSEAKVPLYPDKQHLMFYRDARGIEHRVATPADWEKRRRHILANFEEVAGPLPPDPPKVPLEVKVREETRGDKYVRQSITFAGEAGDRVPAYLLLPHAAPGKLPAMLCLHQTTAIGKGEPVALGGKTNLQYAHELAERGYVTLAPDYPNFGEYKVEVYQLGYASATMKGIFNHRRAVDLLASLPQVDKQCIGVIGHSLGGHNALFVAAFEPRLKAVVTSCGFNSFYKYYGGDLTGWSHAGYLPRIATRYGKDPKQMPFDFTEILAALAPRPVFVNAPLGDANFEVSGVKDCLIAAKPVYQLWDKQLTAWHPDCGHDFPPEIRNAAYEWLDQVLSAKSAK